ncbi:MAG: GDP-L-fucose synthase [Deltaproteobacteria bacterium]|nr:GDP-L-fucose synthase [Deltaproteobacteria bacterium]
MRKSSRIYVAGHTGLLGRALLSVLGERGYTEVITRTHAELDLTDGLAVDGFFKRERPEYVFLSAGLTGGIVANLTYPAAFLHTNIAIQDSVFQAAQKYNAERVVFYGSSCMYPRDCPQPMKEEHMLTGAMEKTSEAYAIAKTVGVIACRAYNAQYKTKRFLALVPNSLYGPYDNFELETSHVLAGLIRRLYEAHIEGRERIALWGSGMPRREFLFSKDAAEASIFAMENADRLENTHYNIGSGADYSIKELAEMAAWGIGYAGAIEWDRTRPDGAERKILDSARFLSLGWRPKVNLEEGLKITCDWFVKNKVKMI